jgi:hypothetical protein
MLVPLVKRSKTFTNAKIKYEITYLQIKLIEDRGEKQSYFYSKTRSCSVIKNIKFKVRILKHGHPLKVVD